MQNNQSDRFEQFNSLDTPRRLNDYDSNLLEEDAYKDIKDDMFKLEYKISKLENEIQLLDSQLQAARDINDYNLVEELVLRKKTLSNELKSYMSIYNNKSLSTKISGNISSFFGAHIKSKFNQLKSNLNTFSEIILGKMPKALLSLLELKDSLTKLKNINRSVDELMTINSPYGENSEKYEQLSKYIIKANSIQAKISKKIK